MTVFMASRLRLFAILTVLILIPVSGCADPPAPMAPPPPVVSVANPIVLPTADVRRYTGRLQAVERVEVRARVKGHLNRVLFREGTEIAKGTLLYEIDPRPFAAEVDQARAEVARLQAEAMAAERDAARARQLHGSVSAEEIDRRLSAEAATAAALARGKAKLEAAMLDWSFTRVVAPIDGRVGRTLVTAGNLVGQGEPTLLTTLVRMDTLHLHFEVPESDLLAFGRQLGQPSSAGSGTGVVRFSVDSDVGTPREAVIDLIDTEVSTGTGTVLVRAVVPNHDRALSPGLFARVEVAVPRPVPLPHVPEVALGTDQQGRYVLVVDAEGKAQRRSISTGPTSNGLVAVERGLSASDRVIVAGQVKVRPGAPVVAEPVADRSLAAKGGAK